MQTNDRPISELMKDVHTGKAQLPDFQRGWVWDDNRIRALIASITSNFPIGAAMFLEYGNENIRFKYRVIEGAPAKDIVPSELILDGQQRLTTLYVLFKYLIKKNNIEMFEDYKRDLFQIEYQTCVMNKDVVENPDHAAYVGKKIG